MCKQDLAETRNTAARRVYARLGEAITPYDRLVGQEHCELFALESPVTTPTHQIGPSPELACQKPP
jgi:hypothetical protein